jgi:hypothetical protein
MKELTKINNKWVSVEEKGCKEYSDIEDDFEGVKPRPIEYKLSREWKSRVTLSEDLGQLRSVLGWTLYQEWIRETITG